MKIKEHIESNLGIWMLGLLFTGFLSGIGAYDGILRISGSRVIGRNAHVLGDGDAAVPAKELEMLREAGSPDSRIRQLYLDRCTRYLTSFHLFNTHNRRSHDVQSKLETAERQFIELLRKWWDKQENAATDPEIPELKMFAAAGFEKGENYEDCSIRFGQNDSWTIPPEISRKIHQR